MNEPTSGPIDDELLAAFVEGELAPSERAAIERALAEDPRLKLRLDGLERVRLALSAPVRNLEGIDLAGAVRARLDEPERSLSLKARAFLGGGLVAAAAALAILVGTRAPGDAEGEFRAKGVALGSVERWTGVQVYRARDGAPEAVSRRFTRSDGLLFAYTNRAETPFEYLMIFGVGEGGRVFWFYPAYERLGDDPRSVPIQTGALEQLLPDVVRHDFLPGRLTLHALFTHRPLGVVEVEAWTEKRRRHPAEPPPEGTHLQVLELDVEP